MIKVNTFIVSTEKFPPELLILHGYATRKTFLAIQRQNSVQLFWLEVNSNTTRQDFVR